jgi:PAS domain S-box-containing protein
MRESGGRRIHYVDGDDRRRDRAVETLATDDRTVDATATATAAIAAVQHDPADCLVVTDEVPHREATVLVRALRDAAPATPVVVAPVDGDETLASDCVAAGAAEYVPLPDGLDGEGADRLRDRLDAVLADARDRRERERALRAERDRSRALFSNTTDCIAYCEYEHGDPIVADVNPAFVETFGYAREAVVGEHIDDVIVPADDRETATAINDRVRQGELLEREVRRRTASGLRDFLLRSVPIASDGVQDAGYAVYTDITERKEREQRLQVLGRVLRHNLRNDMNVVLGTADTLAVDLEDDWAKERVETIQTIGRRLLDRSLHAHEIESTLSRLAEDRIAVPIHDLLRRQADALRGSYPDAVVDIDLAATGSVDADPALETAIEELVTNAVTHNPTATPHVRLRTVDDRDRVLVHVEDDGPGIPREERQVLVGGEESPLHHSSGLGLWLVNWVIRASGGDLQFEERDCGGSRVTVRLPWGDTEYEPPARSETES